MKKIGVIAGIIVLLDQLIKFLIFQNLSLGISHPIISGFFSLTYVQNIGAAWNILSGKQIFLMIGSFIILIAIYIFFIKNKKLSLIEQINFGLLYGGIIGNLMDRLFRGFVVDYLDFCIFGYDFPIFNLADIAIVIGSILLMITIWKEDRVC